MNQTNNDMKLKYEQVVKAADDLVDTHENVQRKLIEADLLDDKSTNLTIALDKISLPASFPFSMPIYPWISGVNHLISIFYS